MSPDPRDAVASFAEAARAEPLDLGEAALRLALGEEPQLDLAPWRAQLEELGLGLRTRLEAGGAPLDVLRGYLFGELGLLGNEADYYDPRNSYLHLVLRRGLGIPISLSVVALEVGRRAGLELFGVGFPGHFLVGAPEGVYLDSFRQGRLLDVEQCADLLHELTGGRVPFDPGLLAPSPPRAILERMLRNLKGCHLRRGELDLALLDVERLLALQEEPRERRDRGLIQLARGDLAEAERDLLAYLETDPSDAAEVREELERGRRRLGEDWI
ncbi:MAG: SirB1 family protein [Planctomycetota bacterium]